LTPTGKPIASGPSFASACLRPGRRRNRDAFRWLDLESCARSRLARAHCSLARAHLAPFHPPRFGAPCRGTAATSGYPAEARRARVASRFAVLYQGRCFYPASATDITLRAPSGSLDSRITSMSGSGSSSRSCVHRKRRLPRSPSSFLPALARAWGRVWPDDVTSGRASLDGEPLALAWPRYSPRNSGHSRGESAFRTCELLIESSPSCAPS